MAERPFQPVPNTPLVADPTGDAIWKRWLQGLQSFLGRAVRGPGSSTDNAVARWDGTSGQFLNNSGVIIDDSNNVSGVVNLTTTGNVQIGDASADELTIYAGLWTIESNYIASREAGTVAAGVVSLSSHTFSATGDSGGTSDIRAYRITPTLEGANNAAALYSVLSNPIHDGTGTLTAIRGQSAFITVINTGNATTAQGFTSQIALTNTGSVTTCNLFDALAPLFPSGTGTITNVRGYRVFNIGNAKVTNAIGLLIENFTNSTTMRGIQSSLSSGAGKHNLYIDGTADNSFAGPIYAAQDNKTIQTASAIYAGTGAPNNANGSDGDFYMRGDGGLLTTIYQRRAGAWVGVV
jgi:hypothetical protein